MSMILEQESTSPMYLEHSSLLDYTHPSITKLIASRGWHAITDPSDLIAEVYSFVRDEIGYGHTKSYALKASQVLSCGYGNCLAKTILLMALLRALWVPCRFHAMTISKVIFRGLLSGVSYAVVKKGQYHAYVEILFNDKWLTIEGHIIDKAYLLKLQQKFPDYMGSFYGYGIAVLNFKNPENTWRESNTYVQNKAIEEDIGIFDSPDDFFSKFPEAETYTQTFWYKTLIRRRLNSSIAAVRLGKA